MSAISRGGLTVQEPGMADCRVKPAMLRGRCWMSGRALDRWQRVVVRDGSGRHGATVSFRCRRAFISSRRVRAGITGPSRGIRGWPAKRSARFTACPSWIEPCVREGPVAGSETGPFRRTSPGEFRACAPRSTADCRIHINSRTARWDAGPVTAADAMDFWAFAPRRGERDHAAVGSRTWDVPHSRVKPAMLRSLLREQLSRAPDQLTGSRHTFVVVTAFFRHLAKRCRRHVKTDPGVATEF